MPATGFDLIVLSEIGYYFAADEWTRMAYALLEPMPKGGTLLATHWLGNSQDHRITGDEVHEILLSLPNIQLEHSERHERFRIDRWVRAAWHKRPTLPCLRIPGNGQTRGDPGGFPVR
jgi:hypothetical protein